jgi:hypothetical protein
MNYAKNTVNYQHKNNPDYEEKQYFGQVLKPPKKSNKSEIYLI